MDMDPYTWWDRFVDDIRSIFGDGRWFMVLFCLAVLYGMDIFLALLAFGRKNGLSYFGGLLAVCCIATVCLHVLYAIARSDPYLSIESDSVEEESSNLGDRLASASRRFFRDSAKRALTKLALFYLYLCTIILALVALGVRSLALGVADVFIFIGTFLFHVFYLVGAV